MTTATMTTATAAPQPAKLADSLYLYMDYLIETYEGPDGSWTVWVSLRKKTLAGPWMGMATLDDALAEGMYIVKTLEGC